MRLTLVTETYYPQVNGVSRTLGQLVRVLTEAGDEVQLIHPDYGEPGRGGAFPDKLVRAWQLPFYKEVFLPLPPFGSTRRAIRAFQPDLIHIATEATLGLSALRFALRSGVPVVSSFHTNFDQYMGHYRVGWAGGTIWRYLRWFHNQTRETYVPSRATILDLEGRGFQRLVLWPRGVDATVFRPDRPGRERVRAALGFSPTDVVICHVSRLAAEKNVSYLADALADLAGRRPEIKLLIVGDGPARGALENRLGSSARFVGYQTGEALADHYAAADLFAFASLTETFGNVILEAKASGLPVVALRAGGVANVVQHESAGILIDPKEPPERMADALENLVADPERRHRMAEAARAYALAQSWDAIMGGLRDRYSAIVGQAPPAPEPLGQ